MCVSLDVVAQHLRTVDAVVRSPVLFLCCVGIGHSLSRGGAIIKVFHHDDQFTLWRLWGVLTLLLLEAVCIEPVWQEVLRRSEVPLQWGQAFILKETWERD